MILLATSLVLGIAGSSDARGPLATVMVHGVYPGLPSVATPPGWTCTGSVTPQQGALSCAPAGSATCNGATVVVTATLAGPLVPFDNASVEGLSECVTVGTWCIVHLPGTLSASSPFSSTASCTDTGTWAPEPTPVSCSWALSAPQLAIDQLTYDVECDYA